MNTNLNDGVVDILLVDDRPDNLLALEATLEPLEQRLVCAASGEEALERIAEHDFAVILLDVHMPGMNGFETARRIKAREGGTFIPIIFLTGMNDDEQAFQGYSVGAVDYVSKPFQPVLLRSKVQVFVELRLQQRRIAQQEQRIREIERHELGLRHVRELERLNEELRAHQLELERALSARSRFYASMSHELRTPLNALLGYSTLLLEHIYGPLNDKQAEAIERTQRAARHLLELVNDVLDLSKIEAGKVDLRLQSVEFPQLIEDLLVTVRPLADEHGASLSLEGSVDGSIKVVSDPRRLRQILLNLLSNAIKFGRGQPIKITCSRGTDGGAVIAVADRGDGISDEDQERIFQEFVQLGKPTLQNGTGLGLPISRRLAELLRGSLTVTSVRGEGSTFYLQLPRSAEGRSYLVERESLSNLTDQTAFPRRAPARPARPAR